MLRFAVPNFISIGQPSRPCRAKTQKTCEKKHRTFSFIAGMRRPISNKLDQLIEDVRTIFEPAKLFSDMIGSSTARDPKKLGKLIQRLYLLQQLKYPRSFAQCSTHCIHCYSFVCCHICSSSFFGTVV